MNLPPWEVGGSGQKGAGGQEGGLGTKSNPQQLIGLIKKLTEEVKVKTPQLCKGRSNCSVPE